MIIPEESITFVFDEENQKSTECIVTAVSDETVAIASKFILQGKVVLLPTETVYGLSVNAQNSEAVQKLSVIKGSSPQKPHLVLVSDSIMLEQYAHVTDLAWKLLETCKDQPLTVVLSPRDNQLPAVQSDDGAVGFRISQHDFCRKLIEIAEVPLVSTSANTSGKVCCYDVPSVVRQIGLQHIALVVNSGELPLSLASTIVDARGKKATLLRKGAIPLGVLTPYLK
jgi:L-threonylcarbamoyladenylate synthase